MDQPGNIPGTTSFRSGDQSLSTVLSNLAPGTWHGVTSISSRYKHLGLTFSYGAGSSRPSSEPLNLFGSIILLGRPSFRVPPTQRVTSPPRSLQGHLGYGPGGFHSISKHSWGQALCCTPPFGGSFHTTAGTRTRSPSMRQGLATLEAPGPKSDQLRAAPSYGAARR